jgi:hypothetical protein
MDSCQQLFLPRTQNWLFLPFFPVPRPTPIAGIGPANNCQEVIRLRRLPGSTPDAPWFAACGNLVLAGAALLAGREGSLPLSLEGIESQWELCLGATWAKLLSLGSGPKGMQRPASCQASPHTLCLLLGIPLESLWFDSCSVMEGHSLALGPPNMALWVFCC